MRSGFECKPDESERTWGKEQYQTAKAHLVTCMQQGQAWQQASASARLRISQSNAYRLMNAVRQHGEAPLKDGRHGHPMKLRGEARAFLKDACRKAPHTPSSTVQEALRERFALTEHARTEGARQRRLALYEHVVALYKQGGTIQGIAKQLGITCARYTCSCELEPFLSEPSHHGPECS